CAKMKNFNISGLELREDGGSCTLLLKVVPRSAQNKIVGVENGLLKLRIQAPPAEGAANEVVIRFLSDCLGRARTTIEIVKGQRSRHKTIRLRGMTAIQVLGAL